VDPTLCCYYKSSRIKQYFKEGRALRTETVICDTGDFGVGRRVCGQNWNALRGVGESGNRCLCDAEAANARPAPDVATLAFWRIAAYHGDDALLLSCVEHLRSTRALLLIECTVQAGLLIAMAEPPNRLGREWDNLGNVRRVGLLSQL